MRKTLLVVDLQPEFAKDRYGKKLYKALLDYVSTAHVSYDRVVALIYQNEDSANMHRIVHWDEMHEIEGIDFRTDYALYHSGYYPTEDLTYIEDYDTVDIIGFDTDACVLNTCFSIFNYDVKFRILINGCWSSGGKEMHQAGLKIMERQFPKAICRDVKFM